MKHCGLVRNAALALPQARPRLIPQRFSNAIWTENKECRLRKEKAIEQMKRWSSTAAHGIAVYSDGSKSERDRGGYGFVVYRDKRVIAKGKDQIGKGEVFDAEVTGALEGLRAAAAQRQPDEQITVCIDNTAVIDCIGATAPPSSQIAFRTFQKTGDAHPGMIRNELADRLANEGATMPAGDRVLTISYGKRHVGSLLAIAFQRWWEVDRPSYRGLRLKAELRKHPGLRFPRRQLGYLLAARTHHGDFADYHERFNHDSAETRCPCRRRKSPTHLFYCKKIPRSLRPRLEPEPDKAFRNYVGRSFKTFAKLADFYYTKISGSKGRRLCLAGDRAVTQPPKQEQLLVKLLIFISFVTWKHALTRLAAQHS
ncbi:hypothetical protein NLG97_g3121 [Lecanicillium saksenae]|uniref:Uncharacterized protein n=1 Tax=Lecanicillium saksenae TaxID=468837 RepID=A0ACC1R0Q0_9HYPO|nr:hypothetical protein NLG97_g3121 [Lecanicillium saksenae]